MCYIFFQTRDCLWEYSEADRVGEEDGRPQGESLKSCLCLMVTPFSCVLLAKKTKKSSHQAMQ